MRAAIISLLGVLWLASPATADDKPLIGLVIGAHVADLITTEVGLAHGFRETNPLLQHRAGRIAINAGVCALQSALIRQQWRRGHHGTAIAAALVSAGIAGGVTAWNMRQIAQQSRNP